MKLSALFEGIQAELIQGDWDMEVNDFHFDSRKIATSDLFFAIKGTVVDGHKFIEKAIDQGATVVALEDIPAELKPGIAYVKVRDGRRELASVAANFYQRPAEKLKIVGVTGTNGKTTTATLLHKAFQAMGYTSGLISTIRYLVGDEVYPSSHTTPDPKQLQELFAKMVDYGCEYCFMEVSSHALVQRRVEGIEFQMGLFTNITHDHLDYHGTFKAYLEAKKMLFDGLGKNATAIVNIDDKNGRVMVQNSPANVKTYALKRMADYKAKLIENTFEGLNLEIDGEEVWFQMRGSFNAYNLLMVYAAARELEVEKEEILKTLSGIGGVAGRFELIHGPSNERGIVDYAHTPDALKNVLDTIEDINKGAHRIITVVGCGGDRDREKRPIMAQIAVDHSDQVILTSDNPRSEEPGVIVDEMMAGVPVVSQRKVLKILDRREAIRTASALAREGDIILLAGKGHETYQEIKGVKHPFDDREELGKALGL
ncbi:MAG: UDP-N-acetylmuramoyl-L-alanyl-D-glutamate--2,6-diaminopimelate ligase [Bacteroidia bacterium]|nr:UDP-N-acetylmuramoyl-L-alanyl-D-glutamate--2,6-diaminopimelate ligase [Bacteroidia bacterium]